METKMESLNEGLLKFNPNTLWEVRKEFNLEGPGRMDEAINILEEWIKKQEHFLKKDFKREYLERIILNAKGSLERAKSRIEKTCILRTLTPALYSPCNVKEDLHNMDIIVSALLPRLTPQNRRVYVFKTDAREVSQEQIANYFKKSSCQWEYVLCHDYNTGFEIIVDFRNLNVVDLITKMTVSNVYKYSTMALEGHGFRMKGFHLISESKFADALIKFIKQLFSPNIRDRVHHHTNLESLYSFVPKSLLPEEYGGEEISLYKLKALWLEEFSSEKHMDHLRDIDKAKIDESRRPLEKISEEYFGIPGTFRNLKVD